MTPEILWHYRGFTVYELALGINQINSHSNHREQMSCVFLYNFLHLSPPHGTFIVITTTTRSTSTPTPFQCYGVIFQSYQLLFDPKRRWLPYLLQVLLTSISRPWPQWTPHTQSDQADRIDADEQLLCLSKEGTTWENRIQIQKREKSQRFDDALFGQDWGEIWLSYVAGKSTKQCLWRICLCLEKFHWYDNPVIPVLRLTTLAKYEVTCIWNTKDWK